MADHDPEVEAWFGGLPDDQRLRAAQLSDLIQQAADQLDEAVKWGRLTFTVDGNWHQWLYAIGTTKTAVKLIFHKGALLDDPSGLLEGEGRYLRQVHHDAAIPSRGRHPYRSRGDRPPDRHARQLTMAGGRLTDVMGAGPAPRAVGNHGCRAPNY